MNKEFGVNVDGVNPGLDNTIKIVRQSKRSKRQKGIYALSYDDKVISNQYPNKKIPSLVEDLLNVALATFASDLATPRDTFVSANPSSKEGRFFSRKIHLKIPVSDKKKWKSIKDLLEKAVSFMTYDLFSYSFVSIKKKNIQIKSKSSDYDSVALFSGGLDSFAGSYYLTKKKKPLFVSVQHGGIKDLLKETYAISNIKENKLIVEFKKHAKGKGGKFHESTQFSRSLVYLSIATSIAIGNSINKIYIPENGVIANQIGLNEDRFGTRTVNPIFLSYFKTLISNLFSSDFEIISPFNYMTKGEVVKLIENPKAIIKTNSCAHYSMFQPTGYCGMCMPCILRIVSLTAKGITLDREISKKSINSFLINLDNLAIGKNIPLWTKITWNFYRDAIINVLDLIKFANEIQTLSKTELLTKYYQFYDEELYNMYVRFSIEIIKTLEYYSKKNPSLRNRIPKINKTNELKNG